MGGLGDGMSSHLLADVVLAMHAGVVMFIAGGLAAIWAGHALGWGWVRNRRFRLAHLALMALITAEAVTHVVCPLTALEGALRTAAGQAVYNGSFVRHWTHRLLFHDWPDWVFTALYLAMLALIVFAWFVVRPRAAQPRRA